MKHILQNNLKITKKYYVYKNLLPFYILEMGAINIKKCAT